MKLHYFDHVILAYGVMTDPSKVEAVQAWPTPKNLTRVWNFMGLALYYRWFVKGFAESDRPLHRLIEKGSISVEWLLTGCFWEVEIWSYYSSNITLSRPPMPFHLGYRYKWYGDWGCFDTGSKWLGVSGGISKKVHHKQISVFTFTKYFN